MTAMTNAFELAHGLRALRQLCLDDGGGRRSWRRLGSGRWPSGRRAQGMGGPEGPLAGCRSVAVRNLTHKLVVRSDPLDADHDSELYDLVADPYELQNVSADPAFAPLKAELKDKMLNWLVQTSDITPWSVCDRNTGVCGATPFRR